MSDTQRRVVCAANQYDIVDPIDGWGKVIITGIRHYCPLMRQNLKSWVDLIDRSSEEQGFVDQYGVFMDRFEALMVAQDAGQLNICRPKTSPENRLFSEDLY